MKRICVYCGSSDGRSPAYADAARALGAALVERGTTLVYGGASVGSMGTIADEVLRLGGTAIGVIPESLVQWEVAHPNLTELHVTKSMHERKAKMADLADAFIAMPGGIGTLEEIFEVWTWAQLGFHQKPCGMLNIDGYYDALLAFLDHTVTEQFVKPVHRSVLIADPSPRDLLARLDAYEAPPNDKWNAGER